MYRHIKKNKIGFIDLQKIVKNTDAMLFFLKNATTICVYKDKRIVKIASNKFSNELILENPEKVSCRAWPLMLAKYRANMIWVDYLIKEFKPMHIHIDFRNGGSIYLSMLEIAINNSYLVFIESAKGRKRRHTWTIDFS